MSVSIRLARHGSKGNPVYHMVALSTRGRRDGRFLAKLGTYYPKIEDASAKLKVDQEAYQAWVAKGAVPSQTVKQLVSKLA